MTTKEKMYGDVVKDKIYFIKQFDCLGLNKGYTGYYMLIDVVSLLMGCDKKIVSFSKEIYPIVAKRFNKTECTVERNIRNLIEKSWTESLIKKLKLDLTEDEKPTCRDFIFSIKNYLMKQLF